MTRTDDLITGLVLLPAAPALNPARMGVIALLAIVVPITLFLSVLGPRPDLAQAWANPVVPFKTLLPLTLCALSLAIALRLTRPEARPGLFPLWFTLPAGIAVALWGGAFIMRPSYLRFAEVDQLALAECLGLIPLLAAIPAVTTLRLLREGASTSPTLSGALAGLAAASGAATGYSLFCTRDNPLFFVTWYGTAIGIVVLLSALAGRRWLRW